MIRLCDKEIKSEFNLFPPPVFPGAALCALAQPLFDKLFFNLFKTIACDTRAGAGRMLPLCVTLRLGEEQNSLSLDGESGENFSNYYSLRDLISV
jgi:hypothetical protein